MVISGPLDLGQRRVKTLTRQYVTMALPQYLFVNFVRSPGVCMRKDSLVWKASKTSSQMWT